MRRAKLKDYIYHLICHAPVFVPPSAAIPAVRTQAR
jgi:hypothetical protein